MEGVEETREATRREIRGYNIKEEARRREAGFVVI